MLLVSSFTFTSPVASTMVAPALDTIAAEFKVESDVEKFLVMSIFLLAYAGEHITLHLTGRFSDVMD
jgi:hypothetical protein